MGKPWHDESELRRLYHEEGLLGPQIADKFGVGNTTIYQWMDRFGIDRDRGPVPVDIPDEDELRRLYHEEHLSVGEIADRCGTSYTPIYDAMVDYSIERRTTGGHQTPPTLRDEEWVYEQHYPKQKSAVEIASDLGCTPRTVREWMRRHGIENRNSSNLDRDAKDILSDKSELERLYLGEMKSQSEIAEMIGVDQGTVSRWLNRHEIETRTRSDITGELHHHYNPEATGHVYDVHWRTIRENVFELKGAECIRCGIAREEHQDKVGIDLDIHHIIPQYEIDDKYDTDNLVPICRSCHTTIEQTTEQITIE